MSFLEQINTDDLNDMSTYSYENWWIPMDFRVD